MAPPIPGSLSKTPGSSSRAESLSTSPTYRLLVSRGVTQRLHARSLDDVRSTAGVGEDWERMDRLCVRERVRGEVERRGVRWGE